MARYNGPSGAASSSTSQEPSGGGGPPVDDRAVAPEGGFITMPDLFGVMRPHAENILHRAGLLGDIKYDTNQCEDSVVHGRVMERGMVCYQTPAPGTKQRDHFPVVLVVQAEDPWHGNVGKVTEWRLMPKLKGMTLEAARAEMKRVGFTVEDNINLEYSDDPTCEPNIVCVTYPPEMSRAGIHSNTTIRAGTPPGGAPTSAPPQPADPSTPTIAPTSAPPDPTSAPIPQPFF